MAMKPSKRRPKDILDVSNKYYSGVKKGNETRFINDGSSLLSTSYERKLGREYITNYEKTDKKGNYPKYQVPKGSAKTAQAERGKTVSRAKKVETTAKRKVATQKLAAKTSQAERGRTQSRKNTARKPKRLY